MANDDVSRETVGNPELRETLAALTHERWSDWMAHLFRCMRKNDEGLWEVPPDKAIRWERQMDTPFAFLPEDEKQSDRAEADSILALLAAYENDAPAAVSGGATLSS